jgi:hypothetical protein
LVLVTVFKVSSSDVITSIATGGAQAALAHTGIASELRLGGAFGAGLLLMMGLVALFYSRFRSREGAPN